MDVPNKSKRMLLKSGLALGLSNLVSIQEILAKNDPFFMMDATAQADLIRKGEVSIEEMVMSAINRIEAVDGYLNAVVTRSFEEALRKLNIPYKIFGGLSFYQRKEIKDLLAYYRLSANLNDEEALKRIINYPKRGIGLTTINKAIICANQKDVSLWAVLKDPNLFGFEVNTGTRSKLDQFTSMILNYNSRLNKSDAYELALEIAKNTGLIRDLSSDRTPEGIVRFENVQELLNGIQEFSKNSEEDSLVALGDFLIDVALLTDADKEEEDNINKVSLMTIHAAKGLEFSNIHVVGMEEDLFPSMLAKNSKSDLEEERRLFYVAVTRAKANLTLSYAVSRFRWGNLIQCEPSRFLEELDPKHIEHTFSRKRFSEPLKKSFSKSLSQPLKNKFSNPSLRLKNKKALNVLGNGMDRSLVIVEGAE